MSVVSGGSRQSGGSRYRRVGAGSEVDEGLFGAAKHAEPGRGASASAPLREAGRRAAVATSGAGAGAAKSPSADAIVMSSHELSIMRKHAENKSAAEREAERAAQLAARRSRAALGEQRKAKMMALEQRRQAAEPLTELEQEEEEEKERARIRAEYVLEERMDSVKTMNSMVAYAKTVTVRDRQVSEKRERTAKEKEAERLLDLQVEIARLEEVKRVRDREEALRAQRIVKRREVELQMAENEARRKAELEARQREAAQVVARIHAMEEEDRAAAQDKRARESAFRAEVLAANEAAIRTKAERRAAEIAEDRRLEEDQRRRDEEAIAAELDRERERLRKEEEAFKLRGAVQKFHDDSEAVAELAMRRAFEEGQRRAREATERRAVERKRMEEEIKEARDEQIRVRELTRALEIERERAEFDEALRARRSWMDDEKRRREERVARDRAHIREVLTQAETRHETVRLDRTGRAAAGVETVAHTEAELDRLRAVRERKISELVESGVASRYTVQLARFDPRAVLNQDYKLGPPRVVKPEPGAAAAAAAPRAK